MGASIFCYMLWPYQRYSPPDISEEQPIPFVVPVKEGKVIKVYDGYTITVQFKLPYKSSPLYKISVRLNGIDSVLLYRVIVKEIIPMSDFSENVRFPIFGGLMQPSAGTARHDAVAWGYARQADSMGVDIIQNCEVMGFDVSAGKINGIRTSRGDIKVKKIGHAFTKGEKENSD